MELLDKMLNCFLYLLHDFGWIIVCINLYHMDTSNAPVHLNGTEIKITFFRKHTEFLQIVKSDCILPVISFFMNETYVSLNRTSFASCCSSWVFVVLRRLWRILRTVSFTSRSSTMSGFIRSLGQWYTVSPLGGSCRFLSLTSSATANAAVECQNLGYMSHHYYLLMNIQLYTGKQTHLQEKS